MKCKCPTCHATGSLEMFIGHSEVSQAFVAVLSLTGDLAKPLIKYLGLFRSENRDLSFERTAKLINELAPDIVAKQITRNRQTFPAPQSAWIWAINVILERREQGKLQLPLKNHGYLYEVISSYKPELAPTPIATRPSIAVADQTSMLDKISQGTMTDQQHLEQQLKEHERQKHEPPAFSIGDAIKFSSKTRNNPDRMLKGIPNDQLLAHISKHKHQDETFDQCFERLKALETKDTTTGEAV
ncbi:DUF2752 domain-containing protein [Acinetobacter sp. c2-A9]|uniref:DUF2752 domain-containing protein n=1 Tax=Acinetobacter sp. c2-A9 TaxID=3342802 RepID=UPI0035B932D9